MKNKSYKLINKAKFDKLSILEKRVAICEDVLARIDAGKIKPKVRYIFLNAEKILDIKDNSKIAQKKLNSNQCEVCVKGALICSLIGNFNNYDAIQIKRIGANTRFFDFPCELIEIFGQKLLDAMEVIFERESFPWTHSEIAENNKEIFKEFRNNKNEDKKNPNTRLCAIMQNIIKNKGVLKCGNLIIGEIEDNNDNE